LRFSSLHRSPIFCFREWAELFGCRLVVDGLDFVV
jgi:hypothetical protein